MWNEEFEKKAAEKKGECELICGDVLNLFADGMLKKKGNTK